VLRAQLASKLLESSHGEGGFLLLFGNFNSHRLAMGGTLAQIRVFFLHLADEGGDLRELRIFFRQVAGPVCLLNIAIKIHPKAVLEFAQALFHLLLGF